MSTPASAPPRRALRGAGVDTTVTGEGVLIDLPSANVGTRVVAAIVDFVLLMTLMVAAMTVIPSLLGDSTSDATLNTIILLIVVTTYLVIPVTIETLTRGRSVGKLIMKLRVVRDDGGPIVFRHAFVRGLVGVVEIFLLYGIPAILTVIASSKGKRLGDMAAGTYVVREETAMVLAAPPLMPPRLAAWAHHADIGTMPDGLALAIRQYLSRALTLTPAARDRVSGELLEAALPLVSPAPPAGLPRDEVLAAILAERRIRDAARLAQEADIRRRALPPDAF